MALSSFHEHSLLDELLVLGFDQIYPLLSQGFAKVVILVGDVNLPLRLLE